MTRNQTTITGPNSRPIRWVPWCWMANRPTRMTSVTGRMNDAKPGAASFSPSIAESTDIAGVMTPSPYSSAAPMMPSIIGREIRRPAISRSPSTSDSKARMPPSPSLSARNTNCTYLTDTISTSAQKMSETTPLTSVGVGTVCPVAFSAMEKA